MIRPLVYYRGLFMNLSLSNPAIGSRRWLSAFGAAASSLIIYGCATPDPAQVSASQAINTAPVSQTTSGDLKLVLNFTNVPDVPGSLMIAVYDKPESFRKVSYKSMKMASTPGEMQVEIPGLRAGEYAVMVFHDQNGDGKLNRNLLGIPQEHWSGSLNTTFVLGAPSWEQTRFNLQETGKSIQVNF